MKTHASGNTFVDTAAVNSKTECYKSKENSIYVAIVVLEKAT